MWQGIRRLKSLLEVPNTRQFFKAKYLGPMYYFHLGAKTELEQLAPDNKHWTARAHRSLAIAGTLLKNKEVLAVPTDLVYNLTCAIDEHAVRKIYEIQNQDPNDPLPICLSSVTDLRKWCYMDHLPRNLLENVLPGSVTYILPRKNTLTSKFNRKHKTVAVRVPLSKFVRNLAALTGPIVLTPVNLGDEKVATEAEEFSELWPKLGGIFYEGGTHKTKCNTKSAVIDLSKPGRFRIVHEGQTTAATKTYFSRMGLKYTI